MRFPPAPHSRKPGLALAGALACLAAASAQAGSLRIYVTTPDGKPAPDTVVSVHPQGAAPPAPAASETVVLTQKDTRFVPYVTVVPAGTTLRFTNRDRFDHHVKTLPGGPLGTLAPIKSFEFRIAGTRGSTENSFDVKMDVPGTLLLGCHLHGSMRGHVFVGSTPWAAVTDAAGRAIVEGVPDGAAELRLWHPDQLVEQATTAAQLAGASTLEARLNFTPRSRPPPRPKGEYDF